MMLFFLARHELICRLRSEPPHLLLTISVAALGALAIVPLWLINAALPYPPANIGFSAFGAPAGASWQGVLTSHRGEALVVMLSSGLILLTVIVAPVAACATLNRERGGEAIDGLLLTGLNPLAIVAGKFLAALARTLLALCAGLPAFAVAWLFGGVSLRSAALGAAAIFALATAGVAIGLFMSAMTKSNLAAVLYSYALLITVTLLLPAASLVATAINGDGPWRQLLYASMPIVLVGTHVDLIEAAHRLIPMPFRFMLLQSSDVAAQAGLAHTWLVAMIAGHLSASGLLVVLSGILLDPLHPVRRLIPRRLWLGAAP